MNGGKNKNNCLPVDTEICVNKDKMFYFAVQVTHVHLWHPGHYGPYLEDIEKLDMVEYTFISSNGVGEARELLIMSLRPSWGT